MRYCLTSLLALLTIVGLGAPAYAGPNWSHYSKPFDLVWDRNNEDLNGLPLNPQWAYQLEHTGKLPNFQAICGGAFYNAQGMTASSTSGSGNNAVNNATLASTCTSQHAYLDVSKSSMVGDWYAASLAGQSQAYCTSGAGGFNGHLTWTVATYTGSAFWSDWSGNPHWYNFDLDDGDYNLAFFPDSYAPNYQAGFTALNNSNNGEHGIGLEFNDGETVDNAGTSWWQQLVNSVENGAQPSPNDIVDETSVFWPGVTSETAVVTGAVGIDGVHGDYAEVHPVYALALQTSSTRVLNGKVTETWAYFLRNSGSGGGCSSQTLYWQAPEYDDNRDARYFIGLPWPIGATGVKVLQNSGFSWQGEQPVAGSWVGPSSKKGWTEVDVVFYDKAQNDVGGLDGQVTLQYTVPTASKNKMSKPRAPVPANKTERYKEDAINVDFRILIPDAGARAKFQVDAAGPLAPFEIQPKVKPVAFTKLAVEPQAHRKAASNGELTPPKAAVDPVKQGRETAVKNLMDTYRPQMRPLNAATPKPQRDR